MENGRSRRTPFPLATDPASVRQRVEALERVMERLVVLPGLNRPVGLDVILDLVPVVGSTAAAAIGAEKPAKKETHPVMKPHSGPKAWVRYTYSPPELGKLMPNSE